MHDTVILVHGLWYGKTAMRPLSRRLKRAGFRVRVFGYASRSGELAQLAARLHRFTLAGQGRRVHFVAHSMGGLVVLRLFADHAGIPPGRIVLLGTPVQGSRVAARIGAWPGAGILLGRSASLLREGFARAPTDRETGVVAGTRPLGLGRLSGALGEPNDGTVAVSETRLPETRDRALVHTSHSGLLVSPRVARCVVAFLRSGLFPVGADSGIA